MQNLKLDDFYQKCYSSKCAVIDLDIRSSKSQSKESTWFILSVNRTVSGLSIMIFDIVVTLT